ncbi:glycosyltransferase [Nesterenkonia muleiensis]|uniref:glycosyltransferase n=1 Tax=Nesterenkonia muleiensis TaxID=2282648 RepID=UPI000E75D9B5|nr:glycosyltransferase [Nesterenkonia muleiensis]
MRIVQVVNTLNHKDGGPARNSFELNLAFNAADTTSASLIWIQGGWNSTVAATQEAEGFLLPIKPRQIHIQPKKKEYRIGLIKVWKLLQESDSVILHGYFLYWLPFLTIISRFAGSKVYIMPHGALTPHELQKKRIKKYIYLQTAGRVVNALTSSLVTGSPQERNDVAARVSARAEWAGVGTVIPKEQPAARGISAPIQLVTLSRLAPKKRIDLAIRAVSILRSRGCEASLTVAGSGDTSTEESLREIVTTEALEDHVGFAGLVTGADKRELLFSADIFVLPSEDENFGIAVAEAAAHGLAVVASGNVASANGLSDSVAAIVRELSAESIADAVIELSRGYSMDTRRLARREAEEQFSWGEVAHRWHEIMAQ